MPPFARSTAITRISDIFRILLPHYGGFKVADAPLARQSIAASGKPALSAAAEALWRRRLATARRAHTRCVGLDESKILQEFVQESDRNRRALRGIMRDAFSV